MLPAGAGLAGANVELPRMEGFEQRLRECLAPMRDRFEYILLDCPPSLGPLTVSALVAADRVIVPVQTEYFALEGLAGLLETLALVQRELNPRLTVAGMLLTMHDDRTRLGQDVEREVREHFPDLVFDTVIPRNVRVGRGAELRAAGDPSRSPQRRRGGVLRAGQGGGGAWLEPKPGMGRGLERDPVGVGGAGEAPSEELRELPVELIAPNPSQPRRRFDEEALHALAGSLGERGVLQPVLVRPQAGRDATSWSPASAAGAPRGSRAWRRSRRSCASATTRAALELALIENMAREDLSPIEEARACAALVEELGLTREEVGRRVGRSRVAVSNLMRLLDLPDEVIELLQDGRAQRGPRPRAAAGRGPRRAPRASRATAAQEGWSVRTTEAARARAATPSAAPARTTHGASPRRAPHPDQRAGRAARSPRRSSGALGAEVRVQPARGGGYRAELSFATPRRRSSWRGALRAARRDRVARDRARVAARSHHSGQVRRLDRHCAQSCVGRPAIGARLGDNICTATRHAAQRAISSVG